MASQGSSENFLFLAEDEQNLSCQQHEQGEWHLLIVDDEEEIHTVTRLVLKDLELLGKKLVFHHAYSGAQALRFLQNNTDIAVILLDVVMETDDAGLHVVQQIREQLKLDDVRIILRTGQPGYAPEESVIKEYDINDYKTKTELTRAKLTTSVIAALRSYQQIKTINQSRIGLQKIIKAGANLLEQQSLHDFSEGVVTQISSLIGLRAEGVLCAQIEDDGTASDNIYVLGAAGHYAPYIKCQLEKLDNPRIISQIMECLQSGQNIYTEHDTVLFLGSEKYSAAVYIETHNPIDELDRQLIEIFLSNISVGYENVTLFQQLKHAAYIDPLTKTPNRNEFIQILQDTRRYDGDNKVAVLIDVDHFSDINDGLGQDTGNELLIAITLRLIKRFGMAIQLGRIGADVFGLVGDASLLTPEKLNDVFAEPFSLSEHSVQVSVSLGLCRLEDSGEHGLSILKHVYIALNKAKKHIGRNYQYYQTEMEEEMAERLSMLRMLRADFERGKLQLWYQPQICLKTRKITGMEALLRWPQGNGQFISPAVFIPLAEYSGLIIEIGDWVLKEACLQLRRLQQQGATDLKVAVNVSMQQFRSPHFVTSVMQYLQHYQIRSSLLELEITESVVMDDPNTVIDALNRLKECGVKVAIDDFGIGFSSLNYLQQLPLDRIKVDRSFVQNIDNTAGMAIAQAIINLGKHLGLTTIAEGIETLEQQRIVQQLGCDEGQGYLYSYPLPAEQLLHFLAAQNKPEQASP